MRVNHGRRVLGLVIAVVLLVAAAPAFAGTLDASWIAPTTNRDGTPLTDLASYRLYYGTSNPPCPGSSFVQVSAAAASPTANQSVVSKLTGLRTGTLYYVAVTAVDSSGNESPFSTPVQSGVAAIDFAVSPTGTIDFGNVTVTLSVDRTLTM